MKKEIAALLLASALLAAPLTACNTAQNGGDKIDHTTNTTITEAEEKADTKPARKVPTFHNGVWGNSNVTYTFNQNGDFSVHIADWNEDHLVTSLSDLEISAGKYSATAVGVNNERAFLVLEQFYEPKITVVSFERGSQSEIVVELDVDETMYEVEGYILSGSFISEKVGYLFVFTEVVGGHSRGSAKLSHFFKTEDGGNTWQSLNVQNIPLLDLRNHIIYAKMINYFNMNLMKVLLIMLYLLMNLLAH